MPSYDYRCKCGCITEKFWKIEERRKEVACEECGQRAIRIYTSHVERQEPSWLGGALEMLPSDAQHISDRAGLERYKKQNGLVQG